MSTEPLQHVRVIVHRTTFDDTFDQQVAKALFQNFPSVQHCTTGILCDVCQKTHEAKDRDQVLRKLCNTCTKYYDHCVTCPVPTVCPLCKQDLKI